MPFILTGGMHAKGRQAKNEYYVSAAFWFACTHTYLHTHNQAAVVNRIYRRALLDTPAATYIYIARLYLCLNVCGRVCSATHTYTPCCVQCSATHIAVEVPSVIIYTGGSYLYSSAECASTTNAS